MFKEQLIMLFPLAISFFVIASIQAFLLAKTSAKYYIKFITIPALILIGFFAFKFVDHEMGYAYPTELPPKFIFLGFNVIVTDKDHRELELWVQSEPNRTRLYRIPHSTALERKLRDMEERKNERMVEIIGEFKKKQKENDLDITENFQFYPFDIAKEHPKTEDSTSPPISN